MILPAWGGWIFLLPLLLPSLLGEEMRLFGSKWEKHKEEWRGVGEEVSGWIAKYAREKLAAASVQEKGGEEKG